ncbi:hypothetical protein Chor_016556, partial [Crotalus horridus]
KCSPALKFWHEFIHSRFCAWFLLQLTREFFTKELKKHYQGNNESDVFSSTWNSVMITFGCCGVNGPEDFEAPSHSILLDSHPAVPEACCKRELQSRDGAFINKEECLKGKEVYQNQQGCYTVILNSLETYVYLAGALAIGVLAIEVQYKLGSCWPQSCHKMPPFPYAFECLVTIMLCEKYIAKFGLHSN